METRSVSSRKLKLESVWSRPLTKKSIAAQGNLAARKLDILHSPDRKPKNLFRRTMNYVAQKINSLLQRQRVVVPTAEEDRLHKRLVKFFNNAQEGSMTYERWTKLVQSAESLAGKNDRSQFWPTLLIDAFINQWPDSGTESEVALNRISQLLSLISSEKVMEIVNSTKSRTYIRGYSNNYDFASVHCILKVLQNQSRHLFEEKYRDLEKCLDKSHIPLLQHCNYSLEKLGLKDLSAAICEKINSLTMKAEQPEEKDLAEPIAVKTNETAENPTLSILDEIAVAHGLPVSKPALDASTSKTNVTVRNPEGIKPLSNQSEPSARNSTDAKQKFYTRKFLHNDLKGIASLLGKNPSEQEEIYAAISLFHSRLHQSSVDSPNKWISDQLALIREKTTPKESIRILLFFHHSSATYSQVAQLLADDDRIDEQMHPDLFRNRLTRIDLFNSICKGIKNNFTPRVDPQI